MFLGVWNIGGHLGCSGSHLALSGNERKFLKKLNVRERSGTMKRVDVVVVDGSGRRTVVGYEFKCTGEG